MKKFITVAVIAAMALSLLTLTACGKVNLALSENTAKAMTLEANNARPNDFVMVGTLEVADGEQIVVTPDLKKGAFQLEFVGAPAEQSIDELPDLDGEATVSLEVSGTDPSSLAAEPGDYLLRVTCLKSATGTVLIEVQAAE